MSDKKNETAVALLVAESEFLRAHGWVPCTPIHPGGDVVWVNGSGDALGQDNAVIIQRRRNNEHTTRR